MSPAVFIARLAGPFFIAAAAGMLVNQAIYAAMIAEFVHSHALIYIAGLLALVGGLAILNVHRAWTSDWRVIITVLGWLMVIGGVVRIVLPQLTATAATVIYSGPPAMVILAVIMLALGGFLSLQGYRK